MMSFLQIRKLRLKSPLPRALIWRGWNGIRAVSEPMETLGLRLGNHKGMRQRLWVGQGSGVPLFIPTDLQRVDTGRPGGRRSACPSPLLTSRRGHTNFPTQALAALEVPLALAICLTVIGGVQHHTLAQDHRAPPRLPTW